MFRFLSFDVGTRNLAAMELEPDVTRRRTGLRIVALDLIDLGTNNATEACSALVARLHATPWLNSEHIGCVLIESQPPKFGRHNMTAVSHAIQTYYETRRALQGGGERPSIRFVSPQNKLSLPFPDAPNFADEVPVALASQPQHARNKWLAEQHTTWLLREDGDYERWWPEFRRFERAHDLCDAYLQAVSEARRMREASRRARRDAATVAFQQWYDKISH